MLLNGSAAAHVAVTANFRKSRRDGVSSLKAVSKEDKSLYPHPLDSKRVT
jgi:hypothetical protein